MAKKKKFSEKQFENLNRLKIEYYVSKVNEIYNDLIEEFAKIASNISNINTKPVFDFDAYPVVKDRIAAVMLSTNLKVINTLVEGIDDAVSRSNIKNDALVDSVFNAFKGRISKTKLAKYETHNLEAAVTREIKNELSQKVYKITKQFKRISEVGIDNGIASGKSARKLATEIKKSVKTPDFAFRRVKNEKGNLEWSKAAKKYAKENPGATGPGKYLNPQKNFERLTRTEINQAYKQADHNRMQNFDFVVGIKVNLSNNPNHCKLCIRLAGVYPPDFLFRNWHPQCRCYVTTILKTPDEISRDNIRILEGNEPLKASVNRVKKPNEGFYQWLKENDERIEQMKKRKTLPYWYLDNIQNGKVVPGRVVGGIPKT